MEVDEDSIGASGETLVRNGVLTNAGHAEGNVAMDSSQDSDILVEVHTTPTNRRSSRALPAVPADRLAISWVTSLQGRRGKMATCRCCNEQFNQGDVRFSKESDFTSSSGRYFHLSCIPGGLHAQDTVQGEPTQDVQVAAAIEAARQSPTDDPTTAELADRSSFVGVGPSDMQRGLAFWNSWSWPTAFRNVHNTLIEYRSPYVTDSQTEKTPLCLSSCTSLTTVQMPS